MTETIYVTGDYEYEQYRVSGIEADVLDASDASWIVSNIGDDLNRYPFLVEDSVSGLIIKGGTINGEVPLDMDWEDAYVNSAAVLVRDHADGAIIDWKISGAWDGIRVDGESDGFLVDNIWMTEIRDDAIENDDASSGTISNSLFDGVFSGISLADSGTPDSSDNIVTIDGVLMRMETYLYKGEVTHSAPLKVEDTSPSIKIYDSIFAIEDIDHIRGHKTELGWDKTIDASGNYYLNLSDEPFPDDYPLPGDGWTVLEGQEARDFWEAAKEDWIAEYGGEDDTSDDTLPEDPPAEDPPAEDPPAEDPPAEDPPAEDPPAEDPPAEDPPAEDPPAEDPPAEDPPAEDPPAEDPPAEDPPAEDPPAEDPPAEDPPAEDPPAEDPPAEDPPAEDPPAEDPPAEDPPAEDPPAEDPPAEDPPAEDPPAEDPPAEDPPAEDPPAEDPSAEDPPAEDPPAEDPPAEEEEPRGKPNEAVESGNRGNFLSKIFEMFVKIFGGGGKGNKATEDTTTDEAAATYDTTLADIMPVTEMLDDDVVATEEDDDDPIELIV